MSLFFFKMKIQKNTTNNVVLTLAEKSTLLSPEYLLELISDVTGQVKIIAIDDISQYVESYNKFEITESETEDLQNGIVYLSPVGKWKYNVYEMNSSSPRSLNISESVGIVETGICTVEGDETVRNIFSDDDQKNNPVFDA